MDTRLMLNSISLSGGNRSSTVEAGRKKKGRNEYFKAGSSSEDLLN